MALYAFQEALLNLYTREGALEEFAVDSEAFLSHYDLTVKERGALQSIPLERLRDFRGGLWGKRSHILQRILSQYGRKAVVASSFGKHGPELLMEYLGYPSEIAISEGEYRLLHSLAEHHKDISLGAVARAHREGRARLSTKELFMLVRRIKKYSLEGYRVLLVS